MGISRGQIRGVLDTSEKSLDFIAGGQCIQNDLEKCPLSSEGCCCMEQALGEGSREEEVAAMSAIRLTGVGAGDRGWVPEAFRTGS